MANADTPRGLQPRRYLNGAPWNGQANKYYVAAGDGTAIYVGGLVKPAGAADADGIMSVTGNVSTGNSVLGVVIAVDPVLGAGANGRSSTLYRAASTERYVYVVDDPNVLFAVQDNAAATLTSTVIGNSADLTGFTSGDTATGLSAIEISAATVTASGDGTEDVLIVGLDVRPDNAFGDWADYLVRLNNHFYIDGAAGA